MGEHYTLSATKRESTREARRAERKAGRVLGVIYGGGVEPMALSFDASELLRVYRKAGQSAVIEIDVEGKKINAIVKTVDLHPVRHELQHVDFLVIKAGEKTTVTLSIEYVGESAAIKDLGGMLMTEHTSLEVRCLPKDIPANIEVDLSQLENIGDQVVISDLGLDPKKYEVMGLDEDTMICAVAAPKAVEEEEPETEEGEESAEPEVVGETTEEEAAE